MVFRAKQITRYICGALYIAAGANHFLKTAFYLSIMPPYLPWPLALVEISGLAEIGLGALLMFRRWSVVAGVGVDGAARGRVSGQCAYGDACGAVWVGVAARVVATASSAGGVDGGWAYWYTRPDAMAQVETQTPREAGGRRKPSRTDSKLLH